MISKEELEINLEGVKKRVEAAAKRAGRDVDSVKLIAVSKTNPAEAVENAFNAGISVFGENKVQEMTEKQETLKSINDKLEWHLIGHLQTNKVKYIIGKTALIHSVDSLKLAEEINRLSEKNNTVTDILIEVNIADEESKFGITAGNCEDIVREIAVLKHVRIRGLMCIAPQTDEPESNRKYFQKLRKLSVDINNKNIDNVYMHELSMGMTGDFEVAIEEGATMVRVGTGIFGKRDYSIV